MSIKAQVHHKFKVFVGDLAPDRTLGKLADEVSAFGAKHAAKSIGVEYLESAKKLVISLGYRDDEEHYGVGLESVKLGKFGTEAADQHKLEKAMAEAAAKAGNTICHEIYVTEDHEFVMVFLVQK